MSIHHPSLRHLLNWRCFFFVLPLSPSFLFTPMSGSAFHELVESLNGADPETARALIEKPYVDSIVIPGFGTFEKRHRDERTGRNPQTGEATTIVRLWPSKKLSGLFIQIAFPSSHHLKPAMIIIRATHCEPPLCSILLFHKQQS